MAGTAGVDGASAVYDAAVVILLEAGKGSSVGGRVGREGGKGVIVDNG
jgi:hypothetical protein